MDSIQKTYLVEMAKWQKVIGILMAIGTAFMAVAGLILIFFGNALDLDDEALGNIGGITAGIVYLLAALLYFVFARFLLVSAKSLKAWGIGEAEEDLTNGLKNTKSFFKWNGILSLISIALAVLVIIVVVVVLLMKV
ncbi:MAG: hypothetical protein IJK29_06620 [Bacteroidales bacterium]|nr:hypothetical protein [Bacteroidales bacterium]